MNQLDPDICYRAIETRDPRFDGRFFTAVKTTGIYCRPICPARTPKRENCTFYPSSAAAQNAGYRPCLRCRPEASPEFAVWRGTSNTVSRALALIAEGALDGETADVESLAERLGVGGRQLRRLFDEHLGVSPLAVAQTRRILFAKQLIHETSLPMAEVALASGFGSIRRFNDTFRKLYNRPPRSLRRHRDTQAAADITLQIAYRPSYDWDRMLAHLAARAIPGVESVADGHYRRTVAQDGRYGMFDIVHAPHRNALIATIRFSSVSALPVIVGRIRRVFDTGADVETIGAHLGKDPFMASLVAARPGLRVPGGWDGFELALRAIFGQQVTIGAARQLAGKLVAAYGEPIPLEVTGDAALSHAFPTPERLVEADFAMFGMPRARAATLQTVAAAALADPKLFQTSGSLDEAVARLCALKGIGEWTAHYIALRALRETDAFPASDVALLRAAVDETGARPLPAALAVRAEAWRPWRAYAAQHLWSADVDDAKPAPVAKTIRKKSDAKPPLPARPGADADRRNADSV